MCIELLRLEQLHLQQSSLTICCWAQADVVFFHLPPTGWRTRCHDHSYHCVITGQHCPCVRGVHGHSFIREEWVQWWWTGLTALRGLCVPTVSGTSATSAFSPTAARPSQGSRSSCARCLKPEPCGSDLRSEEMFLNVKRMPTGYIPLIAGAFLPAPSLDPTRGRVIRRGAGVVQSPWYGSEHFRLTGVRATGQLKGKLGWS